MKSSKQNNNTARQETDKTIAVNSPKIDSAILLLPYYRDKIKYDPINKTWIITFPKKNE